MMFPLKSGRPKTHAWLFANELTLCWMVPSVHEEVAWEFKRPHEEDKFLLQGSQVARPRGSARRPK